jgi:hypothetical protein
MTIHVEVTDTFGGVANYSWVRRYEIDDRAKGWTDLALVREAKRQAGWSGVRCTVDRYGDTIEIRPVSQLPRVMFITFDH